METVKILRTKTDLQGTPGNLYVPGFTCATLELPWRHNKQGLSCIPAGTYEVHHAYSPAFRKNLYRLKNVPGRAGVLIHSGNFAGAIDRAYLSHVKGCILLGKSIGILNKQRAVLSSKPTISAFEHFMGKEDFILEIVNLWETWT